MPHPDPPVFQRDPSQPEVINRIAEAMERDATINAFPAAHTVPAVLLQWDFPRGILRLGFARQTDIEVFIGYLRIPDIQLMFAQVDAANAHAAAKANPRLFELGEVMAGKIAMARKLMLDS